ncbi:MAG TPA: glycogen synthase [Candidatus Limnocylindria bacterium]|nr:glycogen synthase [Candidatus Limnocylindria bacterium]
MRVVMLTNEFPPSVYGGAGVHVAELANALRRQVELDVRTFGDQASDEPGWRIRGYAPTASLDDVAETLRPVFGAFSRNLAMAIDPPNADLVHCHTWYTHLGGLVMRQAYGLPLVVTVHSLEPLRPWKREQLGSGYDASAWIEREALEQADAVIAVSDAARQDVLHHFKVDPARVHVVHNGIDVSAFAPDPGGDALARYLIDPAVPYVLFVGRVTRQKGIMTLVEAIPHLDPRIGVVLAAGQPDTAELQAEVAAGVAEAQAAAPTRAIHWIPEVLDRPALRQLYTHAAVFACPSVYEPFGITNLEAMACGVPVVATRVGGIPEVVIHDRTGILVDVPEGTMGPEDVKRVAADLAAAINALVGDPARRAAMGEAGRQRAVEQFSWAEVARRTLAVYDAVVASG